MAEQDALGNFDFSKVMKAGKFVKFEAGKPLTLRILTTDPVVYQNSYEDKDTGEQNITTKFAFIVYNWTEEKAQILQATPNMAKWIADKHVDSDFGANIKKVDIKISPTGEKLLRRYDLQVLPKPRELTVDQIKECAAINLDEEFEEQMGGRMSVYNPDEYNQAAETAQKAEPTKDVVVNDIPEEPINLEDIPF